MKPVEDKKRKQTSTTTKYRKAEERELNTQVANNDAILYLTPVYLFIFLTTKCAVTVFLGFTILMPEEQWP